MASQKGGKKAQPSNVLDLQYENQIRPCIDLIDSLRALGVEKDLGLPAIAVIGDQSSGKSSVLEALSGVCLPRGSGIVTRCPLELRLQKTQKGSGWCGKISYQSQSIELADPSEVEMEVRKAQTCMTGSDNGVSDNLITLEVMSPNAPDLTLIDLPGMTRVALPNQPADIGQQIKNMIDKYISRQETINLVVVPSNVDIATTEALEMAKQVDPFGERTLGILTKPDLVDKGAEKDVVSVVRNLAYPLKKGYMIVKCRGQSEIQNNLSLEDAITKEREFFHRHKYFSVFLNEGYATIPTLAEKLTNELVEHIHRTLPSLEEQVKVKLIIAEEKLKMIGMGAPDNEAEKVAFLIEKMMQFAKDINRNTHSEDQVTNGQPRLFTNIQKLFNHWENILNTSVSKLPNKIKEDINTFENQYRGREMTGFVNFSVFENIARKQICQFEEPAIVKLNEVTNLIQASFTKISAKHFLQYPNLHRSAKAKIKNISSVQQGEAEEGIRTQFKLENIIYCQDTIYGRSLRESREEAEEKAEAAASASINPSPVTRFSNLQQNWPPTSCSYQSMKCPSTSRRISRMQRLVWSIRSL